MRIPALQEYETAKAALAAYTEFSKPYVQRNGWSVIPANAPRPSFQGQELTTDAINAYSTTVELYELANEKPDRIFAYISSASKDGKTDWRVTTWTGEVISSELIAGRAYRNPRPSYTSNTLTPIRAKIAGRWYAGRALGPGLYVKLRALKSA